MNGTMNGAPAVRRRRTRGACRAAILASAALLVAGCGGPESGSGEPSGTEAVVVGPENVYVVEPTTLTSGPVVSGTLTPERRAQVRAQVSGPIVSTSAETGEQVREGQVMARIDDTAIRDSYLSARAQVASAQQAATTAQRNLERSQRLEQAGAIAEADLEAARTQAAAAESQLADARSRLALAKKQLDQTVIRAPMTGVVADRSVDAGDVVQVGGALFTVVDPTSMRLDASVPAQALSGLSVGQTVSFEVRGYEGRSFQGRIRRIAPVADPATRQVDIVVSLPNTEGDLVGGLFAEGRVQTQSATGLAIPESALTGTGGPPAVMRLENGTADRVPVQLGLRDARREMVIVTAGVSAGDTLLLGAAQGVTPGTTVRVQSAAEIPAAGDSAAATTGTTTQS